MTTSPAVARFERLVSAPIDQVTEADLQRLVDDRIEESTELEFKAKLPERSPTGKDEWCKDVVAQANATGGILLLGVGEVRGVASKVLGVAISEDEERHLHQVLASQVTPFLDVDIITTGASQPGAPRCYIIVIGRSPRLPHAIRPAGEADALKWPRRVGRNTVWLSESQVAELYRNRFETVRSQLDRLTTVVEDIRARVDGGSRGWLLLGLVPNVAGHAPVTRDALTAAEAWYHQVPVVPMARKVRSAVRSIAGPRRIVLQHGVTLRKVAPTDK